MRKLNVIVVVLIMILLVDHIIFGGLYMLGAGTGVIRPLALTMLALVIFHALISMAVTIRAEKAGFKTKARYNAENREFWNRRTSGLAILVLGVMHALLLSKNEEGIPRIAFMPRFFELVTPLLILSVYLHLRSNIRPLLIALGIRNVDKKEKFIKAVLMVIMIFAIMAAFYKIVPFLLGGN